MRHELCIPKTRQPRKCRFGENWYANLIRATHPKLCPHKLSRTIKGGGVEIGGLCEGGGVEIGGFVKVAELKLAVCVKVAEEK